MATTKSNNAIPISPETSQRICKHMNDDHAVSVYAMSLSSLPSRGRNIKIKQATMTSISLNDYTLRYVVCRKDSCSLKTVTVPFTPPLSSPQEARPRLIQEHYKSLTPSLTTFLSSDIIFATSSIILLSFILVNLFRDSFPDLLTPRIVAKVRRWLFVALGIHFFEGLYVVFRCVASLKLPWGVTIRWFLLAWWGGYPVTRQVHKLAMIDAKARGRKMGGGGGSKES